MKKNIFSRTFAFIMACILCLGLNITAFAAEPTNSVSATNQSSNHSVRATVPDVQQVFYLSDKNESFIFELPSGMFNADFEVVVYGKSNANYTVTMTHGGTPYSMGVVSGNGGRTNYLRLSYAYAGNYFFDVETSSNSTDEYTVIVNVYNN